jgi:hypothetical protein
MPMWGRCREEATSSSPGSVTTLRGPMKGEASRRILRLIEELEHERKL